MSMSSHVVGIRPPDETYAKMRAIYDACASAGVEVPEAVAEFFGGEPPDGSGVVVDLDHSPAVRTWNGAYASGFEVDVARLPHGITIVRFYNSY